MVALVPTAPASQWDQLARVDREAELAKGHRILEFRGANAAIFTTTEPFILLDGPAGTGKSTADLALAVKLCEEIPGFRALLLRATRASLAEANLVTLEEEVFPPGHPCIARPIDRGSRRSYKFPNGSVIVVGGLDQPEKTYSSQYDLIILIEAVHGVSKLKFAKLLRMLRNAKRPHPDGPDPVTGEPRFLHQIILETNPGDAGHWILDMANKGQLARFRSRHEDNPAYYDADRGQWTARGREYLETLDRIPDPIERASKRYGEWVAARGAVFNSGVLLRHKAKHATGRRFLTGKLVMPVDGARRDAALVERKVELIRFQRLPAEHPEACWKLWCELVEDEQTGILRPPQGTVYAIGADFSWGQEASNTVFAVGDRNRREVVAEMASAQIGPEEAARQLVMAGLWFGGARGLAFLAWERNGPGVSIGRTIVNVLLYPWYYSHVVHGQDSDKPTVRIGWWNDRQSKIDLAMNLSEAYASRKIIDHSVAALEEAMGWVWYKNGGLGPAVLTEESAHAQLTHGDRVIARMVMLEAMERCMAFTPPAVKPPVGTVARELMEEEEARRRRRYKMRR